MISHIVAFFCMPTLLPFWLCGKTINVSCRKISMSAVKVPGTHFRAAVSEELSELYLMCSHHSHTGWNPAKYFGDFFFFMTCLEKRVWASVEQMKWKFLWRLSANISRWSTSKFLQLRVGLQKTWSTAAQRENKKAKYLYIFIQRCRVI